MVYFKRAEFWHRTGFTCVTAGDSLTILKMALSVSFIRLVSSTKRDSSYGALTFSRWDSLPLNMPACAGRTRVQNTNEPSKTLSTKGRVLAQDAWQG